MGLSELKRFLIKELETSRAFIRKSLSSTNNFLKSEYLFVNSQKVIVGRMTK